MRNAGSDISLGRDIIVSIHTVDLFQEKSNVQMDVAMQEGDFLELVEKSSCKIQPKVLFSGLVALRSRAHFVFHRLQ